VPQQAQRSKPADTLGAPFSSRHFAVLNKFTAILT